MQNRNISFSNLNGVLNNNHSTTDDTLTFCSEQLSNHEHPLVRRMVQLEQLVHKPFSRLNIVDDEKLLPNILRRNVSSDIIESYMTNEFPLSIQNKQFRQFVHMFNGTLCFEYGTSADASKQFGIYLLDNKLQNLQLLTDNPGTFAELIFKGDFRDATRAYRDLQK